MRGGENPKKKNENLDMAHHYVGASLPRYFLCLLGVNMGNINLDWAHHYVGASLPRCFLCLIGVKMGTLVSAARFASRAAER